MRSGVGVCDVSTLGKIELTGPDVGAFLDRVYVNTFSTLPVGKARYGLMLREDGFVMDDGTTARLAPERFVMTTTTANAAKVMQHLEFCRQALWPELDVAMHSVTERWAQFAIAGPRSRALLQNLFGPGVDLSNAAFPFMAAREFALGGVEAAAVPDLVLRRTRLRDRGACELWRRADPRADGGGPRTSRLLPTVSRR